LLRLSTRAPIAVRAYFVTTRILARRVPKVVLRQAVKDLPAGEAKAVTDRGRWLPTLLGEGATNSRGGVDEYRALGAPWGFAPEDVTVPVHVFQGAADLLVPEAWGRTLAARIPGAALTSYPGEGHFIALTRRREVLGYLAGDLG
jgi:pimeloyl-ACP methyl ester carboxylesterase